MDDSSSNFSSASPSITPTLVKPTSADDLLSMYEDEGVSKEEAVEQEVEKQAKVQEELPKKIAANNIVKTLEAKDDNTQKDGDNHGEEEKTGEETEKAQKVLDSEVKVLKALFGDTELDIPEEASITQKIGDKEVAVKVKDAVKAYVDQETRWRDIKKAHGNLDNKTKAFQKEEEGVRLKANQVIEMARKGQFIPAIRSLTKLAALESQIDPVDLEMQMIKQLDQVHDFFTKMNPEQRQLYVANRKNEELSKAQKDTETKLQTTQAQQELEKEIETTTRELNISQDDFWKYFNHIAQNYTGEGKRHSTVEEITTGDVAEFHLKLNHVSKITEAIKKVDPNLLEDKELVDAVFGNTWQNEEVRNYSVDEYAQIVKKVLGDRKSVV